MIKQRIKTRLNREFISLLLMLVFLSLLANFAKADTPPKRIAWKGDPIVIQLSVNNERRITFPDSKVVWADIKDSLKGKLTTQIVNNDVYWLASGSFKTTRLTIGEEGSNKVYLFDVSASYAKTNNRRVLVLDGHDPYGTHKKIAPVKKKKAPVSTDKKDSKPKRPTQGYASLIRFAATELYAPKRLRIRTTSIGRTGVNNKSVYHLLRHQIADTKPLAAWRSGKLFVTAIEVKNRTSQALILDPRNIRGTWKAAAFQHGKLTKKGSLTDSTVLYLVSDKPFQRAIQSNPVITLGSQKDSKKSGGRHERK